MPNNFCPFGVLDNLVVPSADVEDIAPGGIELFYEVIRVISGKYLFAKDHLDRLENSLLKSGALTKFNRDALMKSLVDLVESNQVSEGNVKIHAWVQSRELHAAAWFIPHSYPSAEAYTRGVETSIFEATRENPNLKIARAELQKAVSLYIQVKEVFEAILVDDQGYITEGSKTNVFLVLDGQLVTAPDNDVLLGITRAKVLDIALEDGIPLLHRKVHRDELPRAEALFLTGTSPKVLPVARVDSLSFGVGHPIVQHIITKYNELINQSLKENQIIV